MKHTKGEWVSGWGGGVSGPKTPAIGGPTVRDALLYIDWVKRGYASPDPERYYTIVSCGDETVAIIPGEKEERTANAHLIAAAPDLLEALTGIEPLYAEYMALHPDPNDPAFELVIKIVQSARAVIKQAKGE